MKHASFFSGLGLFDKAAELAGYENVFSCEIDPFCNKHLEKNFPLVKQYGSITRVDFTQYRHAIDVVSGGFPCQPYSQAGERKGDRDERALYGQYLRAIDEIRPTWALGENVFGLLTIDGGQTLENMCASLEDLGYEVQPFVIPASAFGAVHRRDRVWILAYSGYWHEQRKEVRKQYQEKSQSGYAFEFERSITRDGSGIITDTNSYHEFDISGEFGKITEEHSFNRNDYKHVADSGGVGWENRFYGKQSKQKANQRGNRHSFGNWLEAATELCRMDDGGPVRMDEFKLTKAQHREVRLKALGNGIYWPIAYMFFKYIKEIELKLAIQPTEKK